MNIIVFAHPTFIHSLSMERFARMIAQGMQARGHAVVVWKPEPLFYRLPLSQFLKKWLGYLDQFVVFPLQVRARLKRLPADTLFVFSDQALGPWVPLVDNRPHVIHVHDFTALRSSLGELVQNPTGWTGQQYQALIRRGFGHGRNFISVSENTRKDLQRFLPGNPRISEVVYNGLNFPFRPMSRVESESRLSASGLSLPVTGFLLHVGGNQWYKNRLGVLEIYEAYVAQEQNPLQLWMVGAPPTYAMKIIAQRVTPKGEVHFLTGLSNEHICAAYSAARLLIFPSLAEGFGWPIAEAMACGCPVLTTGEAPMTEVGGNVAYYIPLRPHTMPGDWAAQSAWRIVEILALPSEEKQRRQAQGLSQVAQFETEQTLNAYEGIYRRVVDGGVR